MNKDAVFLWVLYISIGGAILYFIIDNFYSIFWSLLANALGIAFSVGALVAGAIIIFILIISLGLFIMCSVIPEPIMDAVFG